MTRELMRKKIDIVSHGKRVIGWGKEREQRGLN